MYSLARRTTETAPVVGSRARAAFGFGLAANGSWSLGCTIVPTTDHKHMPLRRPTVIPT
ncbi:MAG: hypothetical protein ABWY80_09295 [Acidimicrobiia bacterium]